MLFANALVMNGMVSEREFVRMRACVLVCLRVRIRPPSLSLFLSFSLSLSLDFPLSASVLKKHKTTWNATSNVHPSGVEVWHRLTDDFMNDRVCLHSSSDFVILSAHDHHQEGAQCGWMCVCWGVGAWDVCVCVCEREREREREQKVEIRVQE